MFCMSQIRKKHGRLRDTPPAMPKQSNETFFRRTSSNQSVIGTFAMFIDIEAFFFDAFVNAHANQFVYDLIKYEGNNSAINHRKERCNYLHLKLVPVAVKGTLRPFAAGYELRGENA